MCMCMKDLEWEIIRFSLKTEGELFEMVKIMLVDGEGSYFSQSLLYSRLSHGSERV